MNTDALPLTFDRETLAAQLSISVFTVDKMRERSLIPQPIKIGRKPVWIASDILAWLESKRPTTGGES